MKTFLCILAVASVANATINLSSLLGGGNSGGKSKSNSQGSYSNNGGPSISTHHQVDHNVNVVHNYGSSQGGGAQHHVVEVLHGYGDGGYDSHADHQEVQVIKVIHEQEASVIHGSDSGGHVKIIRVLHQESPEQIGW